MVFSLLLPNCLNSSTPRLIAPVLKSFSVIIFSNNFKVALLLDPQIAFPNNFKVKLSGIGFHFLFNYLPAIFKLCFFESVKYKCSDYFIHQ